MRAVTPYAGGGESNPLLGDLPQPLAGDGEVLVEVRASGLNRADLLQLGGLYPPPPGEPEIPGLECSGVVLESGGSDRWQSGDRVMALLAGGGHAERVAVPEGQLMRMPDTMDFHTAAAIPEAALTAWTNLVVEAGLVADEWVLITGATGGVGSLAVQVARELGARPIAAGRDLERLRRSGAERVALDDETLPEVVRSMTEGHGVDVFMDLSSGDLFGAHLESLAAQGRLILVGLMAGARAQVSLSLVLGRRLAIRGSLLRPRSRSEKARLVADFSRFAAERLADGRLLPTVQQVFPLDRFGDACAALEQGGGVGKVVIRMGA